MVGVRPPPPPQYRYNCTAKLELTGNLQSIECAASLAGAAVACGAASWEGGLNVWVDAGCLVAVGSVYAFENCSGCEVQER